MDGHYYSVPYSLVKQQLEVRLSAQVVEIFHKGTRVASHQRSPLKGRHSTVATHMPKAHRHYADWTPQRLMLWAAKTGEATAQVVETILASRPHPQQGFRACLGIMRLGKRYGEDRLEAACRRALRIGACSYKSIESILKHDLDQQPLPGPPPCRPRDYASPISVARSITTPTKENPHVEPPNTRQTGRTQTHGHGPSAP